MIGTWLIRATAILAVAGYTLRFLADCSEPPSDWRLRHARRAWSAGALLLTIHVFCAFHFQHAWSHAAAWEHTRQRTLELTGWNFGGGLWANYAITALWLIDAAGWRTRLDWPLRHRRWFWFLQVALAFMMINATVVFGPWYWTPIVTVDVVTLMFCLSRRRKHP